MTTALIAGLLGLVGTVVGAALSTWTARQTADRSNRHAREEQQRQEYRSAVVRFATAINANRTAEMDRWHAGHGGWRDEASASADVYSTRTAVWDAFYELDLSTDNSNLVQLAQRVITSLYSIQGPDSQAEMDRRAGQVNGDLARFIATARTGTVPDPATLIGSTEG